MTVLSGYHWQLPSPAACRRWSGRAWRLWRKLSARRGTPTNRLVNVGLFARETKMAEITLDEFAPFKMREGVSRRKVFGMDSLLVNGNVFLSLSPTGVVYKMNEASSQ